MKLELGHIYDITWSGSTDSATKEGVRGILLEIIDTNDRIYKFKDIELLHGDLKLITWEYTFDLEDTVEENITIETHPEYIL